MTFRVRQSKSTIRIVATAIGIAFVLAGLSLLARLDTQTQQLLGLGTAIAGLVAGVLLFRRMNRRLMRLANVARAIGEGSYAERSDDQGNDAIGLLGRTLNSMGERIHSAITDLATQRADLERSRAELQTRNEELAAQYRSQELFGTFLAGLNAVDINTLAERFTHTVEKVCNVEFVLMYVNDSHTGTLELVTHSGLDSRVSGALVDVGSGGLARRVLELRESRRLDDLELEPLPSVDVGIGHAPVRSVLAMPISFQNVALGVVIVAAVHSVSSTAESTLKRHVDALASALNNAINYKTIQTQSLRLEQVNMELVEADRLRSEFVANMSHELRTPLNSIIGFSGILQKNRDAVLTERELDYAEKINRNGKHLLSLINDILDLSKIESGRMELDIAPTSATAIMSELADMLHVQVESAGLRLETSVNPALGTIEVDAHKLKQVLINLLSNAIKFTERGNISINMYPDSTRVGAFRIDVSDTGIGIAADQLEYIFEAFRQADSSTTRKYGGTGLGLAISRAFVERMGGQLTVSSQIDAGSTFSIVLPIKASEPLSLPAAQPAPSIQSKPLSALGDDRKSPLKHVQSPSKPDSHPSLDSRRRILIVDDDADARDLLASYLDESNVEILLAENGDQAIEMARRLHPDLITLDLMMPGMSGWDVLDRIKQDEELAAIPVIVISIVAESRKAALLGAVDAITKPVSQEKLQQVVSRSLKNNCSISEARVLVVDDEADARDLLTSLLTGRVGEVRTANNGREALAVLEHFRPNLIILDLMMPVMDGISFLRVLRSDKRFEGLPVVILTAKQLGESERRELAMRVAAIVQKGDEALPEKLIGIIESAT